MIAPQPGRRGLHRLSGPYRVGGAADMPSPNTLYVSTYGSEGYDPISPDYDKAFDASSGYYDGFRAQVAAALDSSGLAAIIPLAPDGSDAQTIANTIVGRDQNTYYMALLVQQMQKNANLDPDPDATAVIASYNARQADLKTTGNFVTQALTGLTQFWDDCINEFSDITGISGSRIGVFVVDDLIVICIVTLVVTAVAAYTASEWHNKDLQSQQDQQKIAAVVAKVNADPHSTSADMVAALNAVKVANPGTDPGIIDKTISSITNAALVIGAIYVGVAYILPMFKKNK